MDKFKTLLSFISFLKKRKKFFILPIAIVLILIGLLMIAAQGSVIAPFIYPLF